MFDSQEGHFFTDYKLYSIKKTIMLSELRFALRTTDISGVSNLLPQLKDINETNTSNETLLQEFIKNKHRLKVDDTRIVLLFLRHGANVDITDAYGGTSRMKLLDLGYEVERQYLKTSGNILPPEFEEYFFLDNSRKGF